MKNHITVHTQAPHAESLVIGEKPPILKVLVFIDELESVMESGEPFTVGNKAKGGFGCCLCFKTGALARIIESIDEVMEMIEQASVPKFNLELKASEKN